MEKILLNILDENDSLKCNVCLNEYNEKEYIPICLNCGHSSCLDCLNGMGKKQKNDFKCAKCNIKVKIENKKDLIDNIIILKIIKIFKSFKQINFKSLLKLNFCYCRNCDLFLTNFSAPIHYSINHLLEPISKYTFENFTFILENKNIRISPIIKFYIIIYFFQNPYINKFNDFTIKESFSYNNNYFIFYGITIDDKENFFDTKQTLLYQFLEFALLNNKDKSKNSIKKGYLIGNNGENLIGFFVMNDNKKVLYKALGIINYNNIAFFGFIDFYTNIKKSYFSFDIGLLDNEKSIFFGIFSNNIEFPNFELQEGEIINFFNNGKFNIIKKKNVEISENFYENNLSENFSLIKIYFTEKMVESKNGLRVEIEMNEYDKSLNYIQIIKEQINEIPNKIRIIPFYKKTSNILNTRFINCQITLFKYNINFRLNNEKNGFIFYEKLTNNYFEGYLIKESTLNFFLNKFGNLILKDIIESVDSIYDFFESFISSKLIDFLISYQVFNKNFKFQKYSGYILFHSIYNTLIYFFDDKLKEKIQFQKLNQMRIKDLFPNIYNCKIFLPISNKLKKCKLKSVERGCCSLL